MTQTHGTRILLVRPGAIGDCILWTPIIDYLRRHWTEIWIPSPMVSLIRGVDRVRPIASTGIDLLGLEGIEPPRLLISELKSFDAIVSWYGANRSGFKIALEALGSPCEFHPALPTPGFDGHVTDFFARQVGAVDGLVPKLAAKSLFRRRSIVIQPFSGSYKKNWSLHRFQALARCLTLPVEWLAGPDEELAESHRFETLDDVADWIAGAKLYIGNDSGITHLAAATGIPVLALFGPASPVIWEPRSSNVHVVRTESLDRLAVEHVFEAANRLLG